LSVAAIRRTVPGIEIDGPAQIRGAWPGGGCTFFRASLRCVRGARDRKHGTRDSRTLNAGEHGCRGREMEAESQPPDSRRVPKG